MWLHKIGVNIDNLKRIEVSHQKAAYKSTSSSNREKGLNGPQGKPVTEVEKKAIPLCPLSCNTVSLFCLPFLCYL